MVGPAGYPMKKKRMAMARGAAKRSMAVRRLARVPDGDRHAASSQGASEGTLQSSSGASPEGARQTIRRLKAELAQALKRIEGLQDSAERDFLLDIFNRRGFARELNRSIAYIKRYHATGALIVLDVDRLKPINDAFGHAAGDQVLKAVAGTLSEQVRSSDMVGRLGGDEFGVLLWNLDEADARAKAAALERAIDGLSFAFGDHTVKAGASAGVAILDAQADASRALEEADRAMYVRKAQRRNATSVADPV
jgi:diguanylate cyclase (GGDEF)-like protein